MSSRAEPRLFANLRFDLPAGVVAFLVALPLCLGIALASGAPLFSGIVAGLAGGFVVPLISRSALSVSGPAAGLVAIAAAGIVRVGSFGAFTAAVVIAGAVQMGLGAARAGRVAHYMPSAVVTGMLAAIGLLLIREQVAHTIGYEAGSLSSGVSRVVETVEVGALVVSAASLAILVLWERWPRLGRITRVPGAVVAVACAIGIDALLRRVAPSVALTGEHLVALPSGGLADALALPDLSAFARADVWALGLTLAVVASLETLLNIEAVDKLDPFGRTSPPNRELVAQGVGNVVSGLLGGLPITSVIVRSTAVASSGGRTRCAAFFHGVCLLVAVSFATPLLRRIPLACLAVILIATGYKLAKPRLFANMYRLGARQFVPFVVTVGAIVFTDLLRGVLVGLAVGVAFVLHEIVDRTVEVEHQEDRVVIRFNQQAHFFTRGKLLMALERIPEGKRVLVDARLAASVDHEVEGAIRSFVESARARRIEVEVVGLELAG